MRRRPVPSDDPQADDARLDELLKRRLGRGAATPRELRDTAARLSRVGSASATSGRS